MKNLILCTVVLIVLAFTANAQSTDRDNPTRLTSNEISGLIDSDSRGKFFYYSFQANPGELSITLSVQPEPTSNGYSTSMQQVAYTLYDRNAENILNKVVSTSPSIGTGQVVGRVNITRTQTIILAINITSYTSGNGKYRLRINGAANIGGGGGITAADVQKALSDDDSDVDKATSTKNGNCLPKKGTLIVKMKDGTKKIIDLGEAETVTVVPDN